MSMCKHLTCSEPAAAWFRGPWCSYHVQQFGDDPARHHAAGTNPVTESLPRQRPPDADSETVSVLGGDGVSGTYPSLGAVPPTPAELLDTLAAHGLLDPVDLEWELTQRLEEVP